MIPNNSKHSNYWKKEQDRAYEKQHATTLSKRQRKQLKLNSTKQKYFNLLLVLTKQSAMVRWRRT